MAAYRRNDEKLVMAREMFMADENQQRGSGRGAAAKDVERNENIIIMAKKMASKQLYQLNSILKASKKYENDIFKAKRKRNVKSGVAASMAVALISKRNGEMAESSEKAKSNVENVMKKRKYERRGSAKQSVRLYHYGGEEAASSAKMAIISAAGGVIMKNEHGGVVSAKIGVVAWR
jgi:hypothetical protein